MQFSLRTLLIVLTIAPPLLAGLLFVISWSWEYWPWIFVLCLLSLPQLLLFLLFEMGTILKWLFRKQIEADKARIDRIRQSRDI